MRNGERKAVHHDVEGGDDEQAQDRRDGGTASFKVVQVVSDGSGDLGGTLVTADKPVQVVSGSSCTSITFGETEGSCDHVEESVQPAETLGKRYVRVFGNADGTTLTWSPAAPNGAPSVIDAGLLVPRRVDEVFDAAGAPDDELRLLVWSTVSPVAIPPSLYELDETFRYVPTVLLYDGVENGELVGTELTDAARYRFAMSSDEDSESSNGDVWPWAVIDLNGYGTSSTLEGSSFAAAGRYPRGRCGLSIAAQGTRP